MVETSGGPVVIFTLYVSHEEGIFSSLVPFFGEITS